MILQNGESATLTWEYHDDKHQGFIIYRRSVTPSSPWNELVRVDKWTRYYSDQDDGRLYCYYIKAYAGTLTSARSNIACITVDPPIQLQAD